MLHLPQSPMPHFIRASSVVTISFSPNPSFTRFSRTYFIMIGGPQVMAIVSSGFGATSARTAGTKPSRIGAPGEPASTVRMRIDVAALPPVLQVGLVAEVRVAAHAVDDRDVAVVGAVVEHKEYQRPQGGKADPAADEEYLFALHLLIGEPVAEGCAHAHLVPGSQVVDRGGNLPCLHHAQLQVFFAGGRGVDDEGRSPTPKTESWATWPGSKVKLLIFSGSFRNSL